jgi:hypothetical protein
MDGYSWDIHESSQRQLSSPVLHHASVEGGEGTRDEEYVDAVVNVSEKVSGVSETDGITAGHAASGTTGILTVPISKFRSTVSQGIVEGDTQTP